MSCRVSVTVTVALLLGGAARAAGEDAGVFAASRSFAPAGWEVGDCPASYGTDAVLCAGTETGPFKVDRHIPTLWIRAPGGSCAEAERDVIGRPGVKLTLTRRTSGRCGPAGAPCTELRFKDSRAVDPVAQLVYLVCPAGAPAELVLYGVSARVIDAFEPVARRQSRWQPDR